MRKRSAGEPQQHVQSGLSLLFHMPFGSQIGAWAKGRQIKPAPVPLAAPHYLLIKLSNIFSPSCPARDMKIDLGLIQ